MPQTQLLMLQIRRSDGRKRLGNWYHCCIQVSFPGGTLVEYEVRVPRYKLSEAVQAVQSLSSSCSHLQQSCFRERLEESLARLNATISAVR